MRKNWVLGRRIGIRVSLREKGRVGEVFVIGNVVV